MSETEPNNNKYNPNKNAQFILLKLLKPLASLQLTVVLFVLSLVLVFAGTLAQVDNPIWTAVSDYFRSFYVFIPNQVFARFCQTFRWVSPTAQWPGYFPFPGGWTIGGLMLANLLAAHAVRFKFSMKRIGIISIHAGIILLMLGELNASHLGLQMIVNPLEEQTPELGMLFDETFKGKGLKIKEVIKRGPADKRGLDLKPGEIIFAINGAELNPMVEVSQLLNGKNDETVALLVGVEIPPDPKTKNRRTVEITPMLRERIAPLLYERWIHLNAQKVSEMSNGRVGYIHIPGMDDAGLDRFVRSLYSDNFDKEALVLDVRFNGGGFTHDQVFSYFLAEAGSSATSCARCAAGCS